MYSTASGSGAFQKEVRQCSLIQPSALGKLRCYIGALVHVQLERETKTPQNTSFRTVFEMIALL